MVRVVQRFLVSCVRHFPPAQTAVDGTTTILTVVWVFRAVFLNGFVVPNVLGEFLVVLRVAVSGGSRAFSFRFVDPSNGSFGGLFRLLVCLLSRVLYQVDHRVGSIVWRFHT